MPKAYFVRHKQDPITLEIESFSNKPPPEHTVTGPMNIVKFIKKWDSDRSIKLYVPKKYLIGNFEESDAGIKLNTEIPYIFWGGPILEKYIKAMKSKKLDIIKQVTLHDKLLNDIVQYAMEATEKCMDLGVVANKAYNT